jgi:hypothetical protein
MSPSPTESPSDSTGPPDRQTLALLERQLATDSLVADTRFEPNAYEPHLLRASLDASQYPAPTESARLDLRWFASGDFSIHYVERDSSGSQWECRWDRHPNDHDARLHFHRPPDGDEVEDLSLPSLHPLEVYSTVLTAVEQRLEA